MGKSVKGQRPKLKKGERAEFERFARAARKVGLIVTRSSYIRYFRSPSKVTSNK
jgi:hypothetical protein